MWKVLVLLLTLIIALWFYISYCIKGELLDNPTKSVYDQDREFNNKTHRSNANNSDKKLGHSKIKHHIPKFMLDLYAKSAERKLNEENKQPDVVRSIIPKTTGFLDTGLSYKDYQDNHLLIFEVPSSDEDETLENAELKILSIMDLDSNSVIGWERIIKVSVYDDVNRKLLYLDKVHIHHKNSTWLSFNLTTPVHHLLNTEKNKILKIVISVKAFLPYMQEEKNKFKLSLVPVEEDFEHHYPVLLLTYSSNKDHFTATENTTSVRTFRRRRNIEDDYEEDTNNVWDDDANKKIIARKLKRLRNPCRRKPLYVDFSEIHYDLWIVQPRGYEAYQCQGRCFYPVAEHLSPTKHAIVQALLHSVSPSKASRSCCVPTKLDSISILYVDNKGVLTYRYAYKDMVVTECGCR